ncbi:MAG: hypothetical protein J0L82_13625 [Deltaproteobacteria bacterium]|jgi:hypothetical protein|nr:hypothetical protein [Deltaproteobacteria bacterium]
MKAFTERRRRLGLIVASLTVLLLMFQNFDLPSVPASPPGYIQGSENNFLPVNISTRPYVTKEVKIYQGDGALLPGWVADAGATLQAIAGDDQTPKCAPNDPMREFFCRNPSYHLLQRTSAIVDESFLRMKSGNYLKKQLYRVELEVDPNRDRMRLEFYVNRARKDSAELYFAQGVSIQRVHFSFYSNQSENELGLVTDQVGDVLKINYIRIFRLPIEDQDQLLVNGGFDHGLLKNWTLDPGPSVSVGWPNSSQGVLRYHRQNAAYNSMFMRTILNTEPGKIYKVSTVVLSNNKNMHFLINRVPAHNFIGTSGTDTFAFQAKTTQTEIALGGSHSFSAEFSIDSIQVTESSNSDFELGLTGWTADPRIIVTAIKNDLNYNRNNGLWPNVYINKKIATVPGTQYEVQTQVGSNSHTLVIRVDGIIAKQSTVKSGLVKFLFTAKNSETVVSVGGANSVVATLQLTSFSVSPFWSPGGQYLFATSTKYPGYLGGHQTANQYCAQHALQAKLPGIFKAVLAARFDPYNSTDPRNHYPLLYPLMNTQGYSDGLCDEKGNCENLGNSWAGARKYHVFSAGRTCNDWTQHNYQPTTTYDIRGNPIITQPTIPDHIKLGAVWPPSLSLPDFEHTMSTNPTGQDCATTKLSLMCLQNAETASYKKRKVFGTGFDDFLGSVTHLTGPRMVSGNQYVFQGSSDGTKPIKFLSPLLRNNSYFEYNPYNNNDWTRPLGNYYGDNLEALASGDGLTIEFPEYASSATFTPASLQRLSPLPYVDPHQPESFGGEESSYEVVINDRVVQRFTVPKFNPEVPTQYVSMGQVKVTSLDRTPFKSMKIRVIEGPTDLIRIYGIGYYTVD